jgi:hypothetical protein
MADKRGHFGSEHGKRELDDDFMRQQGPMRRFVKYLHFKNYRDHGAIYQTKAVLPMCCRAE